MKRKYIRPHIQLVSMGEDIAEYDKDLHQGTGYTQGGPGGGDGGEFDGEFDVKGDQGLWAENGSDGIWKDMW